jgi:hypothetical protein
MLEALLLNQTLTLPLLARAAAIGVSEELPRSTGNPAAARS